MVGVVYNKKNTIWDDHINKGSDISQYKLYYFISVNVKLWGIISTTEMNEL